MSKQEIIKDIERHWKDSDVAEKKIRKFQRKLFKIMSVTELHDFCNDEAWNTQVTFDELNELERNDIETKMLEKTNEKQNKRRSMS